MVDFARLKAIPIFSVCNALGIPLKRQRNKMLRGKCPICKSKNPRCFAVNVRDNVWYCHSCKATGDSLELVHLLKRLPKPEAARWLIETFGMPP